MLFFPMNWIQQQGTSPLVSIMLDRILLINRLPELDSGFFGRLETLCSENQYADEWIPVFISLLEVLRETIRVCIRRKKFPKRFDDVCYFFSSMRIPIVFEH